MSDSWTAYLPSLLCGLRLTIVLTAISMVGGTAIGLLLAMMRLSGNWPLRTIAVAYGNLIRGLPLLVQILYIYFGIPLLTGVRMSAVVAGALSLSLYTGAFMAEVIRSGIISVDRGQMEAGRSIGFNHWQTMRLIIIPQAVWTMIPNLANQFSVTLKNTSLLSVIGVTELTMAGQNIYAINFDTMRVLTLVSTLYLVVFFAADRLGAFLEARLSR
jgi:glutamine transport system permease protein